MAQNPALTQLLTDLNAAPHPGMGNDFFAHVGSHMALARTVPPAWFPKTGTATEAQIGGLIANLHSLTTVAWGAYPLNGAAGFGHSGGQSIRKRQMGDSPFRAVGQMGD